MTLKLNSAARLFRILDQAKSIPDNTQAAEGWVKLLSIQEEHPLRRVIAITALTQGMHHEVQSAVAGLKRLSFPANLYEGSFSRVENAISPMLLGQSWIHVRQYLTPETMTALAFCAQILPDEESQISPEEIEDIRACLADLKCCLDDTTVPVRLRSLIEHHVSLIESALIEYPISGAIAFREAGRTALGEMIEAKDQISEAKGHQVISKLDKTWKKVNGAADTALKAEKLTG